MLISFTLQNFKSFRDATLPLGALTVLIGANAAGKSNALEALRLLSWLAQGQKLSSIQYAVNSADKVVRGRIEDLCHQGESQFCLACVLAGSAQIDAYRDLKMKIALRDGELHIVGERVSALLETVPLYDMDQPSKGLSTDAGVAYNNFAKGPNKPHITVSDQMAVFVQLDSAASFQPAHKKAQDLIPRVAKQYQSSLSNILFLDPIPAKMREYSFTADKRLMGDGANLSSVLYRLWGTSDEPHSQQRQDILEFIQSLPEQDIAGLDFLTGPRGEVMVQLIETFSGTPRHYDASLLSDGTLRVLAIAAAMLSAPEGSLVVIEEIDNGVHPSRARHLLDRIKAIAERRHLRVLLSTHNPAMVDALPDSAIRDVVYCYRDPIGGDSKLIRMHDVPDVPELLIQGPLGHLMTTGTLERFVKTHKGPEERKLKAKAWLTALKVAEPGAGE